ncbi:hypothetical protein [Corynebacterium minutissimum]|uniref:hypothetical protein n=1 Tax=Corynebacterium minutissimum TaxID=38301 RepID=UPI001EF2A750|nr:hypothetical protein [Corynebacterium minutissimum]MCG7239563.1 hypothetical protein [Corynebacterium minutissimum]
MTVVFSPMGQLDVTVSRQVASLVYGRFQVVVPDDAEPTRDERYEDGYVYRPKTRPQGRFDLGFVRSDVTIDMNTQISDLEMVVDAAQTRAEGAVFVQQDLSGPGLSGYVPGVDFNVGDLVGLRLFKDAGPIELPVTSVTLLSEAEGWESHVGGAQVDDAVARRKHNSEILRAVDAERRRAAKERRAAAEQRRRDQEQWRAISSTASTALGNTRTLDSQQLSLRNQQSDLDRQQDEIISWSDTMARLIEICAGVFSELQATNSAEWQVVVDRLQYLATAVTDLEDAVIRMDQGQRMYLNNRVGDHNGAYARTLERWRREAWGRLRGYNNQIDALGRISGVRRRK